MSKRSQTTGLPKTGKPVEPPAADPKEGEKAAARKPRLSQEYHSRAEREAEIQRLVILGTGIALAVIVIILVAAIVIDKVIIPNQAVASVEGKNISVSDFQKRVKLDRFFYIQRLSGYISAYRQFGFPDDQILQQLQQDPTASKWLNDLQVPDQMGLTVVNELIEDQIVRNEAQKRGITVSQDQIKKQEQDLIQNYTGATLPTPEPGAEATGEATGEAATAEATANPTATPTPFVSPTPSPTPTITPTPEVSPTATGTPLPTLPPTATLTVAQRTDDYNSARDNFYSTIRSEIGLSEGDMNDYFQIQALREAVRDAVASDVKDKGPFVDSRHILVKTEEEAKDILAALQNGESFAELAKASSTDTGSGAKGGELGWQPVTTYVKPFADAVTTAEIGKFIGPIKSDFGYHIIQVRAREERDLSKDQQDTAKASEFQTWLKDQTDSLKDQIQNNTAVWSSRVPTDPPWPPTQ
jgi:parvulin-like peptidyl-prolyl isomerase